LDRDRSNGPPKVVTHHNRFVDQIKSINLD
jgi:hypothetical protein